MLLGWVKKTNHRIQHELKMLTHLHLNFIMLKNDRGATSRQKKLTESF